MGERRQFELRKKWSLTVAMLGAAAAGGCGEEAECGDCFERGYRVELAGVEVGTRPPPAILFTGWRNGWCQDDVLCTGGPDVFLGELDPGLQDWFCDEEELVVFSPGHAPTVSPVDREVTELSMLLNGATRVEVTLWIVNGVVARDKALSDTESARDDFAELATGIDLRFDIKDFPRARFDELGGLQVDGFYNYAECDFAPLLSLMADGFDADRLNVYYVGGFAVTEAAPGGLYCGYPPTPHPEFIFIDGDWPLSPAGLAHELGHAFGLRRSVQLPDDREEHYGHANELELDPYLSRTNLMQSGARVVEQITVGQIYRMHFDELSWLWHDEDRGSDYPRTCQSSPVRGGSCPPLTLQPQAWP